VDQPPPHVRISIGNACFWPIRAITEGLQFEQGLPNEELSPENQNVNHHALQQEIRWRGRGGPAGNGEMGHGDGPQDAQKPVQYVAVGQCLFEPEEHRDNGNTQNAGGKRYDKRRVLGDQMNPGMDDKSRDGEGDERPQQDQSDIDSGRHGLLVMPFAHPFVSVRLLMRFSMGLLL